MLKKIIITIVIILIAVLSTTATYQYNSKLKNTTPILPPETGIVTDKVITTHFGEDTPVDLNSDGVMDTVFIITENQGGSGTFYYVTGIVNTKNGPINTDKVLLGDRIAPQNISIENKNIVVVNYADRKIDESFVTPPSVGKTLRLKLDADTIRFGIVANNFEGEADPKRMTLNMHPWTWFTTNYSDGKKVVPLTGKNFSITFTDKNTFSAKTDCNGVGGEYSVVGNKITFKNMITTMMYCEGSQESAFTKMLSETQNYMFTSKGELVLELKFDSGSMMFR